MSDRTTAIREALATNVHLKAVTGDLESLRVVVAAARDYADLLDSDPLIIQRDESGVDDAVNRLMQGFNPPADMSINEKVSWKEGVHYAIDFIFDALASAQRESET